MNPLENKLSTIPSEPGVYIMKDSDGEVLYVGKALSLYHRVRSYFQPSAKLHAVTPSMIPHVADIDYIITDNEVEALILENNLIQKYKPKYNIRLKDDKRYPYLKLTNEDFPALSLTRNIERDGSRYFGPYVRARATRQTIRELTKIFPIRTCNLDLSSGRTDYKPCLNYHIGRCSGPCAGLISKEDYRQIVNDVINFLKGNEQVIIEDLTRKMKEAAERLDFERAGLIRDRINSIKQITEKQKVSSGEGEDQDIIGFYQKENTACVVLFMVRNGKLLDREHFFLSGTGGSSDSEIITAFIQQYYHGASFIPRQIILQTDIESPNVIEKWLETKRGSSVILHVPQRGKKLELVKMAEKNAQSILERRMSNVIVDGEDNPILTRLRDILSLPKQPIRIEAFDISNLGSHYAVGSMVVFYDGEPDKSQYRRYRIRTVQGQDDFGMIREVLSRRIHSALTGEIPLPDLMVIDGGRGQLNAALQVLKDTGVNGQPVIAIAKRLEQIFIPQKSEPIVLDGHDPVMHLIQRIRDEAHRFAQSYHKKLRSKELSASILDQIPNVGPKRKQMLIQRFGSVDRIKEASIDELRSIPGITKKVAEDVYRYLNRY